MNLCEMDYAIDEGYALAGGFFMYEEFTPLYVRKETGDVVYQTDEGARMMIAELSVLEPIDLPNQDVVLKGLGAKMYGDAVGVVYGKEGCYVIMTESVAELRPYSALEERSSTIVEIDMNAVDVDGEE